VKASVGAVVAIAAFVALGAGISGQRVVPEPLPWQASIGPFTGNVTALAQSESGAIFALAGAELYRSTNDGATWIRCESQPVHQSGAAHFEPWLATADQRLYASGDPAGPVYVSIDECVTSRAVPPPPAASRTASEWMTVANGVLMAAYEDSLFALREESGAGRDRLGAWTQLSIPTGKRPRVSGRGEAMFLTLSQRLFRTTDRGATWQQLAADGPRFSYVVTGGTRLYAAASAGIWRSADGGETCDAGATWTATGVGGIPVTSLIAGSDAAFASMGDGSLWKSQDAGLTWSRIDARSSDPQSRSPWSVSFRRMILSGNRLLGMTDRELFASDDGGVTWSTSGLSHGITGVARVGGSWFVSTYAGVFRSTDLSNWTECSNGLQDPSVHAITATPSGDLIALQEFLTYRSADGCRSWWPVTRGRVFRMLDERPYRTWPILVSDEPFGIAVLGAGIAQLSLPDRKWIVRAEDSWITAVVRDPQGRYWLGTRAGVARLHADGSVWRVEGAGLEGSVSSLAIDPAGYLLAAIDRRGVFRARLQ
jgi:Two component regulator propeller